MKNENRYVVDVELRHRLQKELPEAVTDELFTRKVMNLLPENRPLSISWIEWIGFIMAGVLLIVFWIMFGQGVVISGVVTVADILMAISFVVIAISLTLGMIRSIR
jgi:hypothetical protein